MKLTHKLLLTIFTLSCSLTLSQNIVSADSVDNNVDTQTTINANNNMQSSVNIQTNQVTADNAIFNKQNVNNTLKTKQKSNKDAKRNKIVKLAQKQVGKAYVWGATGPNAFDCSGLAQYIYRQVGINLPRTTYTQVNYGKRVSLKHLKKGDLLFWGGRSPYHVGIYAGNNQVIHAATPRQGVIKQTLSGYFYPSQAKRIL